MEPEILTDAELHNALRKRRPLFHEVAVDQPMTPQEVEEAFHAATRNRADMGVTNHVLNLLLEPRNPFEPERARKPKMEAVVFGTLLSLVVTAVVAFSLAAPRPS